MRFDLNQLSCTIDETKILLNKRIAFKNTPAIQKMYIYSYKTNLTYATEAIFWESECFYVLEFLISNFFFFLLLCFLEKLYFYSLWFDPSGAQTHDLLHSIEVTE